MCLEKAVLINPKKDITCYKICREMESLTGKCYYVSPFMGYVYELGKLATNKGKYVNVYDDNDGRFLITSNAFHSFKTLKGAQGMMKEMLSKNFRYKIVKCIIPKESNFVYEGIFNVYKGKKYTSYASQQLLPISVVES